MHSTSTAAAGLVAGAGTRRDTHTAAVCGRAGQALAVRQFTAGLGGYAAALAWARQEAGLAWATGGTRHYGPGPARYLTAAGQRAGETGSGRHAGRRRSGNSDATGAARAAREMPARPGPAQMRADGDREALRLPMCDRGNAAIRPAAPGRGQNPARDTPPHQTLPRTPLLPRAAKPARTRTLNHDQFRRPRFTGR